MSNNNQPRSSLIDLIDRGGEGIPLLIMYTGKEVGLVESLLLQPDFTRVYKVFSLQTNSKTLPEFRRVATELIDRLSEEKLRQISVLAFDIVFLLALRSVILSPKLIRSLILVEPQLSVNLESDCNELAFIRKIQCPTLILVSSVSANKNAQQLHNQIPTSWVEKLIKGKEVGVQIASNVLAFKEVPYKCSQKRSVADYS